MAADLNSNDALDVRVARNRRAIYTGLKPFLAEDELMAALSLWQARYSDGPAYALHGFVNEICADEPLRQMRNDIHRSLRQALFGPDEALDVDPLLQIERWNHGRDGMAAPALTKHVMAGKSSAKPSTLIFESVFEDFLHLIEERQPISLQIRNYIDMHLGKVLSNGPVSVQVSRWLRGKQPRLDNGLEVAEMRTILHMAYVLACEYIGPTAADQMLAQAVRHCETQELARQFSPRELL
ncbi:MAG: hypothetical protein AB1591_02110 [Pseudomonadota bacterium]